MPACHPHHRRETADSHLFHRGSSAGQGKTRPCCLPWPGRLWQTLTRGPEKPLTLQCVAKIEALPGDPRGKEAPAHTFHLLAKVLGPGVLQAPQSQYPTLLTLLCFALSSGGAYFKQRQEKKI